jgi:hypothetical protein
MVVQIVYQNARQDLINEHPTGRNPPSITEYEGGMAVQSPLHGICPHLQPHWLRGVTTCLKLDSLRRPGSQYWYFGLCPMERMPGSTG